MLDHRGDLREVAGSDPTVLAALTEPAMYDGLLPAAVHETDASWVFVVGELAYRIKKPLLRGSVNLGTLARRRAACRAELRVNQALAPGIYLGLKAIVATSDGFRFAPPDAADAVEYAVQMRRVDEADTLAGLIAGGALTRAHIRDVARRLADFHERANAIPGGAANHVLDLWRANIRELEQLKHPKRWQLDVLADFGEAFVRAHAREIERRGRDGHIRDGHGDLRCEHVVVSGSVRVIDRIEFDPALRRIDVAADLANLAMDLEARAQHRAARQLVSDYRRAGGSPGSEALRAFYAAHRALMTAKSELTAAAALEPHARGERIERAEQMWTLADQLCWRARRPLVIVVCGPAASGKSTLAAELAERSQLSVVSSDQVRQEHAGLSPDERPGPEHYTGRFSRATYDLLSHAALAELHGNGGVIVDATCAARAQRGRLMHRLDLRAVTRLVIDCRVTLDTALARAAQRIASRQRSSEPAVVAEQFRSFEPLDELPSGSVLALDAEQPIDQQLAALTRAVDRRLSLGHGYSRRLRPPWRLLHSQGPWSPGQ